VIVDSSVIVAILNEEPDGPAFLQAIRDLPPRRISAATYLEIAIVIDRSPDPVVRNRLDELIRDLGIAIEPVTEVQARLARDAHRAFGRNSGHRAKLNFGDCFAYALAKAIGEPLLFKGDDFVHTDVPLVGRRAERQRLSEILAPYRTDAAADIPATAGVSG
jgi:ribonuclease VapC